MSREATEGEETYPDYRERQFHNCSRAAEIIDENIRKSYLKKVDVEIARERVIKILQDNGRLRQNFKPTTVGDITACNSGDTAHRMPALVHDPGGKKRTPRRQAKTH